MSKGNRSNDLSANNPQNKPLLQFNITPPKQNGPSEAERKLEALTQQLEEEMEKKEENEFFGEFNCP